MARSGIDKGLSTSLESSAGRSFGVERFATRSLAQNSLVNLARPRRSKAVSRSKAFRRGIRSKLQRFWLPAKPYRIPRGRAAVLPACRAKLASTRRNVLDMGWPTPRYDLPFPRPRPLPSATGRIPAGPRKIARGNALSAAFAIGLDDFLVALMRANRNREVSRYMLAGQRDGTVFIVSWGLNLIWGSDWASFIWDWV